ncbi:MAG: serine/threonine-protein kinase [Planctomycetota bacterium]
MTAATKPANSDRSNSSSTEEYRSLYQRRLRLLNLLGACFMLAAYVANNTILWIKGETLSGSFLAVPYTVSYVGTFLIFAAGYGLTWGRRRHLLLLRVVDVVGLVGFTTLQALAMWLLRDTPSVVLSLSLPVAYAILLRAVIVPDRAARTALVSLTAELPVFFVAFQIWQICALQPTSDLRDASYGVFIVRGLLGVAVATIASNIIFGLQRQVRQARQLGQYQLEEKIGEGGMGEVYRASHALLRRPTAIKLLRPQMAGEENLARFEREVQLTSQLTHPSTIAIYDFGRTPEGVFYYAMELLRGLNLYDLVAQHGPLGPGRIIHVLDQVCGSLAEAHEAGLIHRDIKPHNLVLCERGGLADFVKVLDFGLVKSLHGDLQVTSEIDGTLVGSPLYLSPEAIRGQPVDSRADLYALGAVGYYLLTGLPLFDATSPFEVLGLQITASPLPPSLRTGRPFPRDLEMLVLACLAKDPGMRPASATELQSRLRECEHAGTWGHDDAARWWAEHAPDVLRGGRAGTRPGTALPGGAAKPGSDSTSATVTIELSAHRH